MTCVSSFWLRNVRDETFRRQEEAADARCILQRAARHLGRINDTSLNEVSKLFTRENPAVMVRSEEGGYAGILTKHDLLAKVI